MKNLTKLTALTLTAALALTACGSSAAATAPAAESAAARILQIHGITRAVDERLVYLALLLGQLRRSEKILHRRAGAAAEQ